MSAAPERHPVLDTPPVPSPTDVADVERRLRRAVDEMGDPMRGPLNRVVFGSAKRLRPALTLRVAALTGATTAGARERALDLATSVELLHCATLVHDDLIDEAATRRGAATVNAAEGAAAAVVGGDQLIAAAMLTAARVDAPAAVAVAETLRDLCRGEALQNASRFDTRVPVAQLLDVVRLKSGSLLRLACRFGALAGGADAALADVLGRFGEAYGVVLQVVDDLVDIASSAERAGKPVGVDFASGVVTLPAALAIRRRPELAELLRPGMDELARARSAALLRAPDVVRDGVRAALRQADDARALLAPAIQLHPGLRELAEEPTRFVERQLRERIDVDRMD